MIDLKSDEHIFIAGTTGSGKSFLAEHLTALYETPVIMLDTKGQFFERQKKKQNIWSDLIPNTDFKVVHNLELLPKVNINKIIYAPVFEELNQDYYNAFFEWVYKREDITVWIDEMMSIADSPMKYPLYLKACYTRGRSKNISLISCTQRPVDIPVIALSNSTHFFVFTLPNNTDRDKIYRSTSQEEFLKVPEKHYFWYYKIGGDKPVLAKIKV